MATIKVDTSDLTRLANMIGAAGQNAGPAINRAVNRAGDMAKTAMIRSLVPQTGLKYGIIKRALKTERATGPSGGAYTISSRGGDIRLKFFSPRETRKGVSAAPRSQRQIFAGSFMKGGRFPGRVTISKFNNNVFKRAGGTRYPIAMQRSGVTIPEEMVSGATEAAFYSTAASVLHQRLAHELLNAILGAGYTTKYR